HSAARRHRVHLGARRPPVPAAGPPTGRACGRGGRTRARYSGRTAAPGGGPPLLDIVEGQRTGQAHGATFTLPTEADAYRSQAREAVAHLQSLPEDKQRDFLVDSGYLVPHWPNPWGRAADVLEQLVIEEEFTGVERPDMGITGWVALTIAQAGTDDQRERWVEPVLRGQVMWCQLFSEPGAGSDAAAVRTAAK